MAFLIITVVVAVFIIVGWVIIMFDKSAPPDPNCPRCKGNGFYNYYHSFNGENIETYCGCKDPNYKEEEK